MQDTGYVYKCSNGETFDIAARIIYDDEKYAAELMSANPEHMDKFVFNGGELLRIPWIDIPDPEETPMNESIPEKAPWKE